MYLSFNIYHYTSLKINSYDFEQNFPCLFCLKPQSRLNSFPSQYASANNRQNHGSAIILDMGIYGHQLAIKYQEGVHNR